MKKFITNALAVAVLFSFAACQPTYKTVIVMSATTDKTNYLVGQSIDLSSVDVTVRYSDGSSDAFTGEDVTYMGPAKFTLTDAAAASTTVTFAYGSMNISDSSTITPVATLVLSIHTPKTVELSNLPTTGTVGTSAADIDFSEVAATVTDAAGNTYEVPANALVLTPTVANAKGEQEVTACTATVYGLSAEVKGIEDWKVTLSEKTTSSYDASKFASIEVTREYYDTASTHVKQDKAWIGDNAKIIVRAVDSEGYKSNPIPYSSSTLNNGANYIADVTIPTAGIAITDKEQTVTITVVQEGVTKQTTVTIPAGSPYVKEIGTVGLKDTSKKYDGGTAFPVEDLKIAFTMAGADEATDSVATTFPGTVIALTKVPANATTSPTTNNTVTVLISYGKDNKTVVEKQITNITVNASTGI